MVLTIQSPQLLHTLIREQNYVERVRNWLDMHLNTLTLPQIAQYNELIQRTDENIRILKLQLKNKRFEDSDPNGCLSEVGCE